MSEVSLERKNPNPKRTAILNAATAEFAARGRAGARVEEIALSSGVNVRLVYHYFASKDRLYAEAVREQLRRERSGLPNIERSEPVASLRKVFGAYFEFCMTQPSYVSLMLWEAAEGWPVVSRLSRSDGGLRVQLMEAIREGQKMGALRTDFDAELMVSSAIGSMLLMPRLVALSEMEDPERRMHARTQMVESLLGALEPHAPTQLSSAAV